MIYCSLFDAGTGGSVTLTSTGGGSSTSADALLVRLVQSVDTIIYLPVMFRSGGGRPKQAGRSVELWLR